MLIFKNTFLILQAKLIQDVLAIRTIDLWNEEIDQYRSEMPLILPAVYIEFLPVQWNTIGAGPTQHGYGTIKIHVVQNIITDSASIDGAALPTQADTLVRFQLVQDVHECLQFFANVLFDELDRVYTYTDHNHDGVIIDIIEYRTTFMPDAVNLNNQYPNQATLPDVEVQPNTVPDGLPTNTGGYIIPV